MEQTLQQKKSDSADQPVRCDCSRVMTAAVHFGPLPWMPESDVETVAKPILHTPTECLRSNFCPCPFL